MDYYNKEENLSTFMPLFKKEIEEGRIRNRKELLAIKREVCRQVGMRNIPKNGEILNYFSQEDREKYASIMVSKPVRVLSGVNVVAIMTKPYDCPHGTCIFCPGGTKFNTPQSYTGFEPAARRALMNAYDPYKQVTIQMQN